MVRLEGPAAGREVIPVVVTLVAVVPAACPAEVIRAAAMAAEVTAAEVMAAVADMAEVGDTDVIERALTASEWSPPSVGGLDLSELGQGSCHRLSFISFNVAS
jgi:hypothetical protein